MTVPTADNSAFNQKYCQDCGGVISRRAEICPHCGVRQFVDSGKSKVTAALFGIFLGSFGVHKFYLGKPVQGIFYLFFFWTFIPAVVGFIEGLIYLSMSDRDFQQKYEYAEMRASPARAPHAERLPLSTMTVRALVALTALGGLAYLMKTPQTSTSTQLQTAASLTPSVAPAPPNVAPTPLQAGPSVTLSGQAKPPSLPASTPTRTTTATTSEDKPCGSTKAQRDAAATAIRSAGYDCKIADSVWITVTLGLR